MIFFILIFSVSDSFSFCGSIFSLSIRDLFSFFSFHLFYCLCMIRFLLSFYFLLSTFSCLPHALFFFFVRAWFVDKKKKWKTWIGALEDMNRNGERKKNRNQSGHTKKNAIWLWYLLRIGGVSALLNFSPSKLFSPL